MTEASQRRQIGKEVLTLLKDHSPLTVEMLQRMLPPPVPKKNIRQALGILRRKGLVDMVIGNSQTFFYQLHQDLPSRHQVSRLLKCDPEQMKRPLLRRQDWFHNEWCEFWSLIIKRTFPEVEVIREHNIEDHPAAKGILQQNANDRDLIPDFLVLFPKTSTQGNVSIAFEIERTRKTNARIQRKLKRYIYETHVDGLIYVCDSGRLSETIRLLYQEKTLERAHKKRGYADHFFLFSDSMSAGADPVHSFINAAGRPTSLISWCHTLRSIQATLRRDAQFLDA